MGVTDYHSCNEDMATIPLIAHMVIIAKHKHREKALAIALAISLIIGILNLFL